LAKSLIPAPRLEQNVCQSHDHTRRVLNRVLSASAISRLRERFAAQADLLIEDLLERGSFEAIADLA